MTKNTLRMAAVLLAAMTLAGCSSTAPKTQGLVGVDQNVTTSPVSSSPPSAPAMPDQSDDARYLRGLTAAWHGSVPSKGFLLSAAQDVCQQMRDGVERGTIQKIPGDDADSKWNNQHLVTAAISVYCPKLGGYATK